MKIHFVSGYYSDLAHKRKPRPEDYWDARNYVWAVKTGEFKHKFLIHRPGGKVVMTAANIGKARKWFGDFIDYSLKHEDAPDDVLLVPIPSKDGLKAARSYRSLDMLRESMRSKTFEKNVEDALRWSEKLAKAHEGGDRQRAFLRDRLALRSKVKDRDVVLIDDLISTGSSMLAARDVLKDAGANVLGGIVCGKTVYDFETKPFGMQSFTFSAEMHEYRA